MAWKSKDELIQLGLSVIKNDVDKNEGSLSYDAIAGTAVIVEDSYYQLENERDNFFVDTAAGEALDRFIIPFNVTRKQATFSTGVISVVGTIGTVIPNGSIVLAGALEFSTVGAQTIGSTGSTSINVVCLSPGTEGNIPAGNITGFKTPIAGIATVTNPAVFTGGYDIETDDALRDRFLEVVRNPATSGNAQSYVNWAQSVPGVGKAKCLPLWNGAGTVKVVIVNAEYDVADATLVNNTKTYIDSVRPVLAGVLTVESATTLAINVTTDIDLVANYDLATVKGWITTNITNHLKEIAFKSTVVSVGQIGRVILDTEGVVDYSTLTLNGGTVNISLGETVIPKAGTIDVT